VVWIDEKKPTQSALAKYFTVRKKPVLRVLEWLLENHEDYKNALYEPARWSQFGDEFVVDELIETIKVVARDEANDTSLRLDIRKVNVEFDRTGVATEDADNDNIIGDLPITSSVVVDSNNIMQSADERLIHGITELQA